MFCLLKGRKVVNFLSIPTLTFKVVFSRSRWPENPTPGLWTQSLPKLPHIKYRTNLRQKKLSWIVQLSFWRGCLLPSFWRISSSFLSLRCLILLMKLQIFHISIKVLQWVPYWLVWLKFEAWLEKNVKIWHVLRTNLMFYIRSLSIPVLFCLC